MLKSFLPRCLQQNFAKRLKMEMTQTVTTEMNYNVIEPPHTREHQGKNKIVKPNVNKK